MNTAAAAIVARLKAAGLLEIAERAAKRAGLRLCDCIELGEVTGGHRTLWTALAKTKTPSQVAAIVGFHEAVIAAELPVPESGPRARKAAPAVAPLAPPGPDLTALVSLIAAAETWSRATTRGRSPSLTFGPPGTRSASSRRSARGTVSHRSGS